MSIKILIAGGTCSGKSTLAKIIAGHTSYPVTSFGGILRDYARASNFPLTVESLQNLGQGLISHLGYDGFLQWIIGHSSNILWDGPLVLDGVRHMAMHESLKRVFPISVLVYCVCGKEMRLERMVNRDGISRQNAERILSHPLEQFISELESQTNLFFQPGDSTDDFLAQLDALIKQQQ